MEKLALLSLKKPFLKGPPASYGSGHVVSVSARHCYVGLRSQELRNANSADVRKQQRLQACEPPLRGYHHTGAMAACMFVQLVIAVSQWQLVQVGHVTAIRATCNFSGITFCHAQPAQPAEPFHCASWPMPRPCRPRMA